MDITDAKMPSETRKINILRMRRNNPCATLQEIGDRFDVTRERVRQVLSDEGKATKAFRQTYLCVQCGKDIGTNPRHRFCSPECKHEYLYIKIACSYCGQLGEYLASHLVWQIGHGRHGTDLFFCSQYCKGKWVGENYGFGQAGNVRLNQDKGDRETYGREHRKWDWSKVYDLRNETGWGAIRLSRTLGIPVTTVSNILSKDKSEARLGMGRNGMKCEMEGCSEKAKFNLYRFNGTKIWVHVCDRHERQIAHDNMRRNG